MDMKNATAVCLISLFAATLVMLIARALDLHAASRLEPQLVKIAEELEALRRQGGITAPSQGAPNVQPIENHLIVYYFHSNVRCPTCQKIESQSHDAVRTEFGSELASGQLVWRILNYEAPGVAELAKKFEIDKPVVVLARMQQGQIEDWKRLDYVWALVGDRPAFIDFVRDEINQMLDSGERPTHDESASRSTVVPIPDGDSFDLPVPTAPSDLPIPQ